MVKLFKYLSLLLFYFYPGLLYAGNENSYTVFIAGNTFEKDKDNTLLNQWQKQAATEKDFAVLLAGNAFDGKTGQFSENLLLNKQHPLLIAPGKAEWADGSREGKNFIKEISKTLPKVG